MTDCLPVILDAGALLSKCGISGDDVPKVFHTSVQIDSSERSTETELEGKKNVPQNTPIERGLVKNWADLEKVWNHAFECVMKVDPKKHQAFLIEPPLNPKTNREKMTSLMFEKFQVPGLYVGISSVLSIYTTGRTSGVVFESGHSISHSVSIYEGYSLPHATVRVNIAGQDIGDYFARLLGERGYSMTSPYERKVVRGFKEKLSYVAKKNYEEERKRIINNPPRCDHNFELPDGSIITFGETRVQAPEILFQPSLINSEEKKVHEAIMQSIEKTDVDIKHSQNVDLHSSIVLCGGNSMLEGFVERTTNELEKVMPRGVKIKVTATPERQSAGFTGASIISSLSSFSGMPIKKSEYEEQGAAIVHKKCF